ncbi:MAG: alkaline phosphatase family protein, partial [Verrucomicrobiota bacterium]
MERKIAEGHIELGYLFTSSLDSLMHRHGTSGPKVDAGFDQLENALRRLYHTAGKNYDAVRFYIFSDHGMADTEKCSNLLPRFEKEIDLAFGRDYVAVWDSTMARFWFENDEARQIIHDWLSRQGDGSLVSAEKLRDWGCDFSDHTYGELFYLLPSGSLFVPSFMNQRKVTAMHGYDPDHENSTACWLTNADVKPPESIAGIFDIMLAASATRLRPVPAVS